MGCLSMIIRASGGRPRQAEFAQMVEALRSEDGVLLGKPTRNTFGRSPLQVDGETFAMITAAGRLVIKLPKDLG